MLVDLAISAVMIANGAHWVSAHEMPSKATNTTEDMKQSPNVAPKRHIEVRICEHIHARGRVNHDKQVLEEIFLLGQLAREGGLEMR